MMTSLIGKHRTLFTLSALGGALLTVRALTRQRRNFSFRDKVVAITGGSRGLGLVLARSLVREGAKVAICARHPDDLARARGQLEKDGAHVLAIPCDVTERHAVDAMLAQVRDRFGPIDVLINNAGIIQVGPMDEMTADDYEQALRVHFWGPLYTMLGVLPEMRRRGEGRIVNIASVGGKISVPHLLPYSASKFALVGLSTGLRPALLPDGVYLTTVCPGLMRTGSPRNALFKGRHHAEYAWFSIAASLPLVTISAERAAQCILEACRHGKAELVMPVSTAALVKLYGLLPELGHDVMSLVERLLPGPGGVGTAMKRGAESTSRWSPSVLTILGDRAAERNNELPA